MDPFVLGILGVLALLLLLVAGVHIGFALGVVGVVGVMILSGVEAAVNNLATGVFYFVTNPNLIVLPLFVMMGLAAMYGGISEAAFDGLSRLAGRLPGGLGIATVAGCAVFGTVCGSSGATALVFAKVACPEMRRHGYEKRFAYGLVSTAGIIGIFIPPSMLAVIYGLLTEESIGKLLLAGIGPGVLLTLLYSACIVIMVRLRPKLAPYISARFTWGQRVAGLRKLWPIMVGALVIIGGIYGGVLTVSESAAWGALAILIIAMSWGGMRWRQLVNALGETLSILAMLFLILTAAKIFARFMLFSGVAQQLLNTMIGVDPTVWQLMLGIVIIYLILGCFLDGVSMQVVTIPIIYPVVKAMGIEPMWFAMIAFLSIEAGLVTPPVGMNVYTVKAVAEEDVTVGDIFIGVLPFLFMTVLAMVIVFVFPPIANWLPQHMIQTQ